MVGATSRQETHEPTPTMIVPMSPTYLDGYVSKMKSEASICASGLVEPMASRISVKTHADVTTAPMEARGTETNGVRSSPALFT
eukprot:652743-Pleurochrysis_carterae.AAC.1